MTPHTRERERERVPNEDQSNASQALAFREDVREVHTWKVSCLSDKREREREFYRIQNVSRLSHDSRKKSKRSLIRILAL